MNEHNDGQVAPLRDQPRHDATGAEYDYSLTIEEAADRYARAGHPRTTRTLQRYCQSGHLDCQKIVTAASAPITVEVAAGAPLAPPPKGTNVAAPAAISPSVPVAAPSASLAAVSPVEQYNLKGWHVIRSVARQSYDLNNLSTGYPELEPTTPDWFSAHWEFEPVQGTAFVRIKNRWKTAYLVVDRGALRVTDSGVGSEFAQWALEPVAGQTFRRIKNRADGRMLVATTGGFGLKSDVATAADAYWYLVPVGAGGGNGRDARPPRHARKTFHRN